MFEHRKKVESAILVGLARDSRLKEEEQKSIDELAELTRSAGARVASSRIQVRSSPDPAFYIGKGLVAEIKEMIEQASANLVIFDDSLSPAQQRNLEKEFAVKVIDRAMLILDIFAKRARTAEARLQVELAQLEYSLPRLTGAWTHLSKQYGGIGTKGPGETQLEVDRRRVRDRIAHLKGKLEKLNVQRATQRKSRQELFKVAIVGYTNAGKSTLFNKLTKGDATTANMLFTTLDSTTRVMSSGYPCRVVFSDTVGFIRKLPHQLVESFKSTLEEVAQADLLLHLVDCTDSHYRERIDETRQLLREIKADSIPFLLIYNKIDSNLEFVPHIENGSRCFLASAVSGQGLDAIRADIIAASERFANSRYHK